LGANPNDEILGESAHLGRKTGRQSGPGIAATATEIPAAAAEDAMVVKRDQWLGGGTSDFYEIS